MVLWLGKWKNERIKKILFFLISVWLEEWKSGIIEKFFV